jgi:hypothetical protein
MNMYVVISVSMVIPLGSFGPLSSICMLISWYSLAVNFGPYGIIFFDVCIVITVIMVMLLRDSGT